MGIQLSTECILPFGEGVFPFLDLPAEIRNQIYRYLLSTQYLKANKVSNSTVRRVPSVDSYPRPLNKTAEQTKPGPRAVHENAVLEPFLQPKSKRRYTFHTAITKVNRQVRYETLHVLRKENLFVRVTSYSEVLDSYENSLKPIVLAQNRQARDFKHHAMAIHIKACANLGHNTKRFPTLGFETTFIIAGDDLPSLCRLLLCMNYDRCESPILECGAIQINLKNLNQEAIVNRGGEPVSHTVSVRRLLEPLRRLRGVRDVHITGDASNSYKQDIKEAITRSPLDVRVSRKAFREACNKGDTAYVSGDFTSAITEYQKGLDTLDQVPGGPPADPREILAIHWGLSSHHPMHDRLRIRLEAAELRLEVERVAYEAAKFAKQHPETTGSGIQSIGRAVYQALMWHFAISLAGKDVAEIAEFRQRLEAVLEREPRNSRVKAPLARIKWKWSRFLGVTRAPSGYNQRGQRGQLVDLTFPHGNDDSADDDSAQDDFVEDDFAEDDFFTYNRGRLG